MLTYNHEKYIAQALDSVLMQKVDFKYEIVVGEDCSTDRTRTILLEYKEKYPHIFKLILHEKNVGAAKNIQAVDRACRGEYIAVLEGDDYWTDPHKLQIQVDEMRKYPDCHMSFHPALEVWEDKRRKNQITGRQAEGNRVFTTREIIKGGGSFCPTASLIFKRDVFDNLPQWFYEAPIGDYFAQIFGSLHGGALYIARPMSVYRRNAPGSWSVTNTHMARQEQYLKDLLVSFDNLECYLDNEFHDDINLKRSKVYLKLAVLYLQQNKFKACHEAITQSHRLANNKSLKLRTCYYLRKFPRFLQGIWKLNFFIKKHTRII
ncbi:glycosyltransferase [Sulfurimonas sp. HSL3-7]|uniref:glycosyltransferase family 2 protein n=1 Tax=Sulfonitrofixus jiaomeiensis TaxID=3131938 RepID=UPI0031F964E0